MRLIPYGLISRSAGTLLVLLAIASLLIAAPVRAQPIANIDSSVPIDFNTNPKLHGVVRVLRVDLGLTGSLGLDRYGMITAWITSGPKAWSGTLVTTYADANGTEVNNYVAAATTPGRVTPVEIIVRLPAGVDSIRISDANSGRVRATLAQTPGPREMALEVEVSGTASVATLGDVSLWRLTMDRVGMTGDATVTADTASNSNPEGFWPNVKVATIKRLPQAWIAYEQCDVVVAMSTALEAMGERGRAPLMDWVRSGGHLVVVNDSSSREWALAGCGNAIDLDDLSQVEAPGLLRRAVMAVPAQPDSPGIMRREVVTSDTKDLIEPYQIRTRPVRVRDPAWKPIWPIVDAADPDRSLGAYGPVGLGTVTVFGGDPGRWVPITSNEQSLAIWRAVVRPSVEHAADVGVYAWMSGARARSEASTRRWLLDSAFAAPLPNPTLLSVLLMLLVVGLAIALGPVDLLLLRRLKLRHRSHRSALAWLAGASLLAYLTPLAIRSSDDSLARGVATDIVLNPDGSLVESSTGATLVYASTGTRVALEGVGEGSWCGVGSIDQNLYYGGATNMVLPPFNVLQTTSPDGVRQGVNPGLTLGQWTFRILEDIQPARDRTSTIRSARVERAGDDWRVTIDGLFGDERTTIKQCLLQVDGMDLGVNLTEQGPGRWSGYANVAASAIGAEPDQYDAYRRSAQSTSLYRVDLPMASRRSRAFEAYAKAPGWSVVTLAVARGDSDVRVKDFASTSLNVIRIAVPTPDASQQKTAMDAEPATNNGMQSDDAQGGEVQGVEASGNDTQGDDASEGAE